MHPGDPYVHDRSPRWRRRALRHEQRRAPLDRSSRRERHLPLVRFDEVVELDQVDVVDGHPLQRALELGPGCGAAALARLGRGNTSPRWSASQGCSRSSHAPYDAAVSMWLMPQSAICASVVSARSWLMPPSAAAPKMTRVESCPVDPKGAVGSDDMSATLAEVSRPGPDRPPRPCGRITARRSDGCSRPRRPPRLRRHRPPRSARTAR